MDFLKEADFRKKIKSGLTGGYLFFGEEDYMKAATLALARNAVNGSPDEDRNSDGAYFNDIRLGGVDFTPTALADAMAVPPMMADKKIITVTGIYIDNMKNAEFDELCEVLDELSRPELDYNLVIISLDSDALDVGTLPKRPSARLTALAERLTPVWFERNTPARLYAWVQKHYQHNGVSADSQICSFTVEWCGRNMYNLASEIDKVSFYVKAHGREVPTPEDIRLVAIPAVEYDAFAFANAVMEHKRDAALDVLSDLKFRRVEPLMILTEVNRVLCDLLSVKALLDSGATVGEVASSMHMHEYKAGLYSKQARSLEISRLREAVKACDDADKSMKLSSKGYGALERLICSL